MKNTVTIPIIILLCIASLSSAQKTPPTTNTTNSTNNTFNEKLTDRAKGKYNGNYYYERLVLDEILDGYDARTLPFIPNPNYPKNQTTYVKMLL